jgi:L-alanine-DL-glutamate epimerase-like enolase superfamily enzyme
LQPQLIAAYETWRPSLPPSNAWFVSVEQGSMAAARLGRNGWDRVHVVRIGAEWLRELRRLQTFSRLASHNPQEGRVYVDAPHAWREVAAGTAAAASDAGALEWLEEPPGPLTTLQRLGRARRMAA